MSFLNEMEDQLNRERDPIYYKVADHYRDTFAKHGDTPQGYDWSNMADMKKRYSVMSDIFLFDSKITMIPTKWLDFGCGAGGFYEHLKNVMSNPSEYDYTGIDINWNAVDLARIKYPEQPFGVLDIHDEAGWAAFNNPKICKQEYDYIICNGTFTVKRDLTQDQMSEFMCVTLEKLWSKTNRGIAFNLMSKLVDWERDDLYHVSMDQIGQFIIDVLGTRNFVIRNDYGLYEYTVYIYK